MSEARVPAHTHCKICGRPVPPEKDYCSVACRNKASSAERRQKRVTRFFTFAMMALLAVFLIFSILGSRP